MKLQMLGLNQLGQFEQAEAHAVAAYESAVAERARKNWHVTPEHVDLAFAKMIRAKAAADAFRRYAPHAQEAA